MDTIFKSLSKTTAFAYFPSSRLPYLSSIPMDFAGFRVAHQTAKIESERTIQMGNGNRGNIMIIKNGLVFTPEGKFEKKDLYVEGEYVAKETTDNKEVEAEGCYVIPGLVDIHFHGCVRHDMCDGTEESIQALADYEAANGVLAICPATMTIPEEELFQAMKAVYGIIQHLPA